MDVEELRNLLKSIRLLVWNRNIAPASGRSMIFPLASGNAAEIDLFRKLHGQIRSFELLSTGAFAVWVGDGEPVTAELSNYPTVTSYSAIGSPQRLFLYQSTGSPINVKVTIWSD